MPAAVDGAAVSWAVAETESVETQHTSHTVTQQTHLYKTHKIIQPESVQRYCMQSTLSGKSQDCIMTALSTVQSDSQ